MLHSYNVEAQGKRYLRTREHLQPIHLNLPQSATQQPLPPKPKVPITCIPKPNPKSKCHSHPISLPGPSSQPPCHICCPPQPYKSTHTTNATPSVEELLWHLSTLDPSSNASVTPEELGVTSPPWLALTPPVTLEEVVAESPASQHDSLTESDSKPSSPVSTCSTASYTLWSRLLIIYIETALSHLHGRPQVRTFNFLSIPLPVSHDDKSGSVASDAPAEVVADSPCTQDESPTCSPRARPTPMTRGGVTSKPTEMPPSMPDGLSTKSQSRSHQCTQDDEAKSMQQPPGPAELSKIQDPRG